MKIAAIILNYNLSQDTISLISDLKKQSLPKDWNLEIIVVDNASADDSVTQIRKVHPDIILLPQSQNLGVAGGYNVGIRYSLKNKKDIIVVSNNDLIIEQKECLSILIKELLTDKNNGIAAPLIYFAKGYEYRNPDAKAAGHIIWYAGGLINWKNIYTPHRGVDETDHNQYSKIEETDFITGAFMVFKREVLEKVGLFNENYYLYMEDAEISERTKRAGFKLLFVPEAKISHKVSQTAGNAIGGNLNDYYTTRNRLQFGMTYAKFQTKFALLREAFKFLFTGRPYQKEAVKDFFLRKFGRKILE